MTSSNISWKAIEAFKKITANETDSVSKIFNKIKSRGHIVRTLIDEPMLNQENNIAYRGDSRHPSKIFSDGFKVKGSHRINSLVVCYRPRMLRTESGICLSKSLEGASFFPLPTPNQQEQKSDSFIYVVNDAKYFNTNRLMSKIVEDSDNFKGIAN